MHGPLPPPSFTYATSASAAQAPSGRHAVDAQSAFALHPSHVFETTLQIGVTPEHASACVASHCTQVRSTHTGAGDGHVSDVVHSCVVASVAASTPAAFGS